MMTIVYRLILVMAIVLIVMELFRQKEFKFQANAARFSVELIIFF